jgi:hypothetical protein
MKTWGIRRYGGLSAMLAKSVPVVEEMSKVGEMLCVSLVIDYSVIILTYHPR